MTQAGIYVRISQDREGGGLGVQRQEQDCRELAERLGFAVSSVYCDNDSSAYSGKLRPAYQRLLTDISSRRIEAVICWHTDRLHRSTTELETYIEAAGEIPTHSVRAGLLDLSTASGRMTARITGAVARHESEHKSERQRRKADELASKGLPLGGGRPFGYESDGLTIREDEARELRRMVTRVLAGDSLAAIIRDLNERSVQTTRGGTWGYSSLRTLLLRERNAGRMQHRGRVVGKAAWEPIISETDHDAVAAVLADPSRRTSPGPARRHLLSGLAKCACGRGMKPGWVKSRGKKYWIYTCPVRGAGHAHRSMSKVDAYVTERALEVLECVYLPDNSVDRSGLEVERRNLQQRQDEAALLFASGQITAAQLTAITSRLTSDLEGVTEQLNASALGSALEGAFGVTQEQWEELSLDRKRKIIDAIMTITVVPLMGERKLGVRAAIRTSSGFGYRVTTELRDTLRAAVS